MSARKGTTPRKSSGTRSSEPMSHFDDETSTTEEEELEEEEEETEEEESEEEEDEDRGDNHAGGDDESEEDEDENEDGGEEESEEEESEEEEEPNDLAALEAIAGVNGMIPKARFDEVLQRASRAEQALIERAIADGTIKVDGQPAKKDDVPAFDLRAKIKARNSAQLEGKDDEALDLDMEIESYRQQQATASAMTIVEQQLMRKDVDTAIADVFKQYPVLNDKSGNRHDPEKLEEVLMYRDHYIARKGMSTAQAIREAAKKVLGDPEEEEDVEPKPRKGKTNPADDTRSLMEKRRALRRARAQPPATHRAGAGRREQLGSELDVSRLSDAKFRSVDPKEKARARGDFDFGKKGG